MKEEKKDGAVSIQSNKQLSESDLSWKSWSSKQTNIDLIYNYRSKGSTKRMFSLPSQKEAHRRSRARKGMVANEAYIPFLIACDPPSQNEKYENEKYKVPDGRP